NTLQRPAVVGPRPAGPDIAGIVNFTNSIVGLPSIPVGITSAPPPRAARPPAPGGLGNVKAPRRSGPTIRWLEHFASPFGLEITSTTGGKHAKGSYHYKGRAVDFSGDPARMAALAKFAVAHHQQITEMVYAGPGNPGVYVKNGEL